MWWQQHNKVRYIIIWTITPAGSCIKHVKGEEVYIYYSSDSSDFETIYQFNHLPWRRQGWGRIDELATAAAAAAASIGSSCFYIVIASTTATDIAVYVLFFGPLFLIMHDLAAAVVVVIVVVVVKVIKSCISILFLISPQFVRKTLTKVRLVRAHLRARVPNKIFSVVCKIVWVKTKSVFFLYKWKPIKLSLYS